MLTKEAATRPPRPQSTATGGTASGATGSTTSNASHGVVHTWLKLDTGNHSDPIVALAVDAAGRTLLSAAECTVRVWDLARGSAQRVLLGHTPPRVEGGSADGTIGALAVSPDGRWVVTLKNRKRVEVFDAATGHLASAFEHRGHPESLAFSPDGRWLALGVTRRHGAVRNRAAIEVLATRTLVTAGFDAPPEPHAAYAIAQTRMVDEVMHLAVTPRWIPVALDDLPAAQARAQRSGRHAARSALGLVVAVHSISEPRVSRLHWLAFRPDRGIAPLRTRATDLPLLDAATLAVGAGAVVVATEVDPDGSEADTPPGRLVAYDHAGRLLGEVRTEQPPAATAFSPAGTEIAVGLRGDEFGDAAAPALVHVFSIAADGFALRSTYYGHDRPVEALVWRDADCVISSGGDNGAIHLWSPRTRVARPTGAGALRGIGQALLDAGIDADGQVRFGTVAPRLRPPQHAARQQRFDLHALRLHTVDPSAPDPAEADNPRWMLGGSGQQVLQIYHRPDTEGWEPQLGRPGHLTLYVGADDTWLLWTRSGFYATNAPQASRFGYCVDRGPRREALFLPADRFAAFDREDIVRAVVEHGSEERARAQGIDIPQIDVALMLPPIVEIERCTVARDRRQARLHLRVEPLDPRQPTTRIWVLRNGRHAWFETPAGATRQRYWHVPIRLNPGRNELKVLAESATAKSVPCTMVIDGPQPRAAAVTRDEAGGGKLFVLSVGVSDFAVAGTPQAGTTQPLRFPRRDATAVYNALARARRDTAREHPALPLRNGAFKRVAGALLVDQRATKAAILAQARQFADEIVARERAAGVERDVLLVFLSGHGTRFKGEPELFFWNWDLVPTGAEMERTGLSLVDFAEIATAVPAEVVLVIDACHAGMAGNNMMRGLDPEELARRVLAIHERGMYVINGARSEQLSWEHGTLRHGVLTSALLETLRATNAARGPRRALSMLALMAAIQEAVPRISARVGIRTPQTPVCRVYGDLLPLTIYQPLAARRRKHGLRGTRPSATVAEPHGSPPRNRKSTMATKKTSAKKAAKKVAKKAVKAVAKKTAKKTAKKAAAKKAPAKKAVKKVAAKKAAAKTPPRKRAASGAAPKPGADVVR